MRADRLLSLLMLLQTRGRMSAQELARELEVCERTIYRDVDALCAAGVPIYADRGRGGGYALVDSYRTNLTGLTPDEVRALFMLNIPAPLAELGVGRDLKAALLKLAAALPSTRREDEERARQRIHLDSTAWSPATEPVPHLQTIQRAVWQDRRLQLTYRHRLHYAAQVGLLVDPYGLVAKASTWYLVAARKGQVRAYRVSRVLDARLTDEPFERPADFDLAAYWRAWCAKVEEEREGYPVTLRVAPDMVPFLPLYFGWGSGDLAAQAGPADARGWIVLTLSFESLEEARARLLGLGRAVEVLQPPALRLSIQDYAAQIVALYEH